MRGCLGSRAAPGLTEFGVKRAVRPAKNFGTQKLSNAVICVAGARDDGRKKIDVPVIPVKACHFCFAAARKTGDLKNSPSFPVI